LVITVRQYQRFDPLSHLHPSLSSSLTPLSHVHQAYPIESCFDHTDAFVLSGSEDGSLYIWDLVEGGREGGKEGKPAAVLREHKRALGSLSFHPSEPVLVTVGYDGVGCCWFRDL